PTPTTDATESPRASRRKQYSWPPPGDPMDGHHNACPTPHQDIFARRIFGEFGDRDRIPMPETRIFDRCSPEFRVCPQDIKLFSIAGCCISKLKQAAMMQPTMFSLQNSVSVPELLKFWIVLPIKLLSGNLTSTREVEGGRKGLPAPEGAQAGSGDS